MVIGILILVGVLVAIAAVIPTFHVEEKSRYKYKRKQYLITKTEHDCFKALESAVGGRYYIFPQVHLPSILDNKVVGQNWRGAFSHINQKSVDFVLCEKTYLSPVLAIELDDRTHNEAGRKIRDANVELMLKEAGLPLLRIQNHGSFNPVELGQKIDESISKS